MESPASLKTSRKGSQAPSAHFYVHVFIARGAVGPLVYAADFQRRLCGDIPLEVPRFSGVASWGA